MINSKNPIKERKIKITLVGCARIIKKHIKPIYINNLKIPFLKKIPSLLSKKQTINFIDLSRQRKSKNKKGLTLKRIINKNIQSVFDHGQYILGPEVSKLEDELKIFTGSEHALGVSSGTDALLIALMALGIGENDEVITTSFSFFATAEVITLLKAKPVFVDIEPDTYNIDPKKIEENISTKTKAIIAVSLYGQPANFKEINAIADKYSIPVIEDAAQSFGSEQNGIKSCNLSTIGITSFFPSKPLGCYGDGGACFTNNFELANKMRMISKHGQEKRYFHTSIGINGRMDTIQAAILLAKLEFYPDEIKKRKYIGEYYSKKLNEIGITSTPNIQEGNTSVYAQFTIQVSSRDAFQRELKAKGLPTAIHYPQILPLQPVYNKTKNKELERIFKTSFKASQRVISLPFHPWLEKKEVDEIVKKTSETLKK